MATNDLMGQQLLEACQRTQVEVPEEVAVVGADNDEPICRIATPPLSSVIINDHQRGYEAAACSWDRMMNGEPPPREPIYVEPAGVRTRASTDFMAIDDVAVTTALRILQENNIASPISVDDVVDRVLLSRSVLERRGFRRMLGRTMNDEIVRLRINRAIELLTETELELKMVAKACGLDSQSYMNAVFKSRIGKTPGSFRRISPGEREGRGKFGRGASEGQRDNSQLTTKSQTQKRRKLQKRDAFGAFFFEFLCELRVYGSLLSATPQDAQ